MSKKIFIKTFGCQMNEYDSNRIYDLAFAAGLNKTEKKEEADCFVINTCHIREKATEKVYHEIGRIKKTFKKLNFNYSPNFIDEISNKYIDTLPTQTFLFDGVIHLLEFLKPKYNLHIITNGFEDVQFKKLKNSKLLSYFEKIINPENVLNSLTNGN